MHFELALDIGAMGLRRLDADAENHGDFFAAFALCQQLHNLALSRAQGFTRS